MNAGLKAIVDHTTIWSDETRAGKGDYGNSYVTTNPEVTSTNGDIHMKADCIKTASISFGFQLAEDPYSVNLTSVGVGTDYSKGLFLNNNRYSVENNTTNITYNNGRVHKQLYGLNGAGPSLENRYNFNGDYYENRTVEQKSINCHGATVLDRIIVTNDYIYAPWLYKEWFQKYNNSSNNQEYFMFNNCNNNYSYDDPYNNTRPKVCEWYNYTDKIDNQALKIERTKDIQYREYVTQERVSLNNDSYRNTLLGNNIYFHGNSNNGGTAPEHYKIYNCIETHTAVGNFLDPLTSTVFMCDICLNFYNDGGGSYSSRVYLNSFICIGARSGNIDYVDPDSNTIYNSINNSTNLNSYDDSRYSVDFRNYEDAHILTAYDLHWLYARKTLKSSEICILTSGTNNPLMYAKDRNEYNVWLCNYSNNDVSMVENASGLWASKYTGMDLIAHSYTTSTDTLTAYNYLKQENTPASIFNYLYISGSKYSNTNSYADAVMGLKMGICDLETSAGLVTRAVIRANIIQLEGDVYVNGTLIAN